jgi:hypothetical protein
MSMIQKENARLTTSIGISNWKTTTPASCGTKSHPPFSPSSFVAYELFAPGVNIILFSPVSSSTMIFAAPVVSPLTVVTPFASIPSFPKASK